MKSFILIIIAANISLSLVAFVLCGADKFLSKRGVRRVPEKVFLLLCAFGGALGLNFGMLTFHHKTNHWYFRLFAVLFTAVWITLIAVLLLVSGNIMPFYPI